MISFDFQQDNDTEQKNQTQCDRSNVLNSELSPEEMIHIVFKCFLFYLLRSSGKQAVQKIAVISAIPDHTEYSATTVSNNMHRV